jgi:putative membrane protein
LGGGYPAEQRGKGPSGPGAEGAKERKAIEHGVGARRTHPLTAISGFLLLGFGVVMDVAFGGAGVQLFISLVGGLQLVGWWFKTYELGPAQLVVRDGILRRRERVVPYRRVQQIDVRRSLLMQVFGLAALRIETAGSQKGTVTLALLGHDTAEGIRALVLSRRHGSGAVTSTAPGAADADLHAPAPAEEPVCWIGGAQLAVAGATSTVAVVFAVLAVLLAPAGVVAAVAVHPAYALVPAGAAMLGITVALIAAVIHVITYADYRLAVSGDDLRLSYGVLDRQHVSMPRARVQRVSVTDNPLRRAVGLASVRVWSAATTGGDREGLAGRLEIPILPRERVAALLPTLMGDDAWCPPVLTPRPRAALRRGVVRRVVLLAVPGFVTLVFSPPVGLAALAASCAAVPWGRLAHRRAGHATTAVVSAFAAGVMRHRIDVVPNTRVQSARTSASPFQRRTGLATIDLDIAGTRHAPSLYDIDAANAATLQQELPRASRRR